MSKKDDKVGKKLDVEKRKKKKGSKKERWKRFAKNRRPILDYALAQKQKRSSITVYIQLRGKFAKIFKASFSPFLS